MRQWPDLGSLVSSSLNLALITYTYTELKICHLHFRRQLSLNKRVAFWRKQPDSDRKLKANTLLIYALYLLSEGKYVKSYITINLFERIIKPEETDEFVIIYSYIWAKISKHSRDSESMLKFTIQGLNEIGNKKHHLKVNFEQFLNDLNNKSTIFQQRKL